MFCANLNLYLKLRTYALYKLFGTRPVNIMSESMTTINLRGGNCNSFYKSHIINDITEETEYGPPMHVNDKGVARRDERKEFMK